jgi:hypothetical protein
VCAVLFEKCLFEANVAQSSHELGGEGGAMYNSFGKFQDCVFILNKAQRSEATEGGANGGAVAAESERFRWTAATIHESFVLILLYYFSFIL